MRIMPPTAGHFCLSLLCTVIFLGESAGQTPTNVRRILRPAPIPVPGGMASNSSMDIPVDIPNLDNTPIESFDFPGGTVTDFAKQLEPLIKPNFDAIEVDGQFRSSIIPPFKSGKTTLYQLLGLANWVTGQRLSGTYRASTRESNLRVVLEIAYNNFNQPSPEESYLAEFDFKGGSISDLVEQIRARNLGWTNIFVAPGAADQSLPAFKVERIRFGQLAEILQKISGNRVTISWSGSFLMIEDRSSQSKSASVSTAILPLRDLLASYKIEDINALVQTALKMRDARTGLGAKQPDMSLHRETSTLVVVGSADQVALVQDVIAALTKQEPQAPAKKEPPSAPPKPTP